MITRLDTDAALFALAEEWAALWRRVPGALPFQHPAWLLPWWRQFGTGQPRVAIERIEGRLTGVLPLYRYEDRLLPIGVSLSDQFDALVEPGRVASPLLAAAMDGEAAAELLDVPAGAALRGVPGLEWSPGVVSPVLPLTGALSAILPARTHRKLRMNRNRAARAGGFAIETATAVTLPGHLDVLIRLHRSRWVAQGESGVLADPIVMAFQRDAAPGLLAAGLLRLQVLRVGGVAAAGCYALLMPGRILFYLSGFDAVFAEVSPGTLLLGAMLEEAIAEGRWEADFLRGGEAYKYAWGGQDRWHYRAQVVAARSSFPSSQPSPGVLRPDLDSDLPEQPCR